MSPLLLKSPRPLAAALAAVLVVGAAYLTWLSPTSPAPAPQVSYTLLDGTPAQLGELRGKVVLVNFWATTCVTCIEEMPRLVATHEKFRARGFETLAVAMSYDPPASVAMYAESRRLPFGVVIDNTGQVARAFGDVRLTPTTFVIDRRGQIVRRYVGEPDFDALHALVEQLLAEAV
jgi:peroxiredoxin